MTRATLFGSIAVFGFLAVTASASAEDNTLTDQEKADGWVLLFDGKTHDGWMTSNRSPSKTPVEEGAINPHRCGAYMMVHEKEWGNFTLSLDFKVSKGCNSGVFVRTSPLESKRGRDVGYNGIEIAIDDSVKNGAHATGAIYDLSPVRADATRKTGEWNHMEITCDRSKITVVLNGVDVNFIDLNDFTEPNKRPDGTPHKFDEAFKNHPRSGYIGLQDHGAPVWFKNIKIKALK
ncbi:MAG: DUF1080 domain-containing protein [Planctomycetaceae bacterium]